MSRLVITMSDNRLSSAHKRVVVEGDKCWRKLEMLPTHGEKRKRYMAQ